MYRPTVRYDEVFRSYVDALFHATHLDRNQILRAALFAAAHSNEFHALLKTYQKRGDVPLPSPFWLLHEHGYWLEQCPKTNREEGDVTNAKLAKRGEIQTDHGNPRGSTGGTGKQHFEPAQGRIGEIPSRIKVTGGGITFTLN